MADMDVRVIVAEGMMKAIDQEARDKLVADAIKHLLAEPSGQYGSRLPSPLATAFHEAVTFVAREMVMESVRGDEIVRARVAEVVRKSLEKLFDSDRMAQLICDKLWQVIER